MKSTCEFSVGEGRPLIEFEMVALGLCLDAGAVLAEDAETVEVLFGSIIGDAVGGLPVEVVAAVLADLHE